MTAFMTGVEPRQTEPQTDPLLGAIERYWGFPALRPLQREAMEASLGGRDSLVVMPTGGGKSLCYQAPAVMRDGLTVVVSPLISLMKDQVDGLLACGVPAALMNSSQSPDEQREVEQALISGTIRLLFVSPERLAMPRFRRLLENTGVAAIAIDEAHCISHWGHDFRPEYRQLRDLRRLFPEVSLHAYTATATAQVRRDIIEQLALREPAELVGTFDRPNLTYRVVPRRSELEQVEEVIARHRGDAGIIYCIRRRDVDELAEALLRRGHRAVAYHAGLSPETRRSAQESFSKEECDIVVATVAFGMGIDRSNVRFVLHTGLPKSIEHYQQETGRAGRDGLEAECVLLYAPSDAAAWKSIMAGGAEEGDADHVRAAFRLVEQMQQYAASPICRHKALVEHFGEPYGREDCGACDVCQGDHEAVPDALVIAQKILSCVVRVREAFGAGHVISVLRGENLEKIRERRHDELTTFGILRGHSKEELRDWIAQLVAQGVLRTEGDPYPLLRMTAKSREVLRGQHAVHLMRPVRRVETARAERGETSWEGVDRPLFERLREWRKREADLRGVPPFVVFGDATLRHLAAVRPSSLARMQTVHGIGEAKLASFGEAVLAIIREHCAQSGASLDTLAAAPAPAPRRPANMETPIRQLVAEAFRRGDSIEAVVAATGRAQSTVVGYLADFIAAERPASADPWVRPGHYEEVTAAAARVGAERLKPIYEELGGRVTYEEIRVVLAFEKLKI